VIKRLWLPVLLIANLVGLDQWIKYLVETRLDYEVQVNILPFFSLLRIHNDGVSFSMLASLGPAGLIALSSAVLAIVVWLWTSVEKERIFAHLGFAFITAGALGNIIDRSLFGVVIDYIQIHTESWSFAIFNLADVFISIGVAAIILDEILAWRSGRNSQDTDNGKHP